MFLIGTHWAAIIKIKIGALQAKKWTFGLIYCALQAKKNESLT